MTPNDVLDIIRAQCFDQSADFWGNDEIYRYMSCAQYEIAERFEDIENVDTSITTTSGVQEYNIPSRTYSIIAVRYDNVPMKFIDLKDKDAIGYIGYGNTDPLSKPTHYYVFSNKIGFYPIPDDAKQVTIYRNIFPVAVTAISTGFEISEEYQRYLADYCLWKMYLKDQDENRAITHYNIWTNNLQEAISKRAKKKSKNRYAVVKDENCYPVTDLGII